MKLFVIILTGLIVLSIAFVYVIIPQAIQLTEIVKIAGNAKAVNRSLMNKSEWKKWWPLYSTDRSDDDLFRYNNYNFKARNIYFEGVEMEIRKDKKTYSSILRTIPVRADSSLVQWKLTIKNNNNLISRINNYTEAGNIKGNMKTILQSLTSYIENPDKVYGIKIENQRVKDTLLITTKMITKDHPSIVSIYTLINNLRTFIETRQAKETNHPMLHVDKTENGYVTMVAIPVNRQLDSNKQYVFKRMVPGNILVSQVKGGVFTVQEALKQMENYIEDKELTSPAISFESLITDRSKEKDTSKWITKLYYPIL